MHQFTPRLIFFELTKRCNLGCIHCRATAQKDPLPGEMTTSEVFTFIDDVASFAKPIMVLTGGEPLYRADIFEIIKHTVGKGLKAALATNGTMITPDIAKKIKEAGVTRVAISLDGAKAETHDGFRMQKGCFEQALNGIRLLREQGVGVQINATVTTHNLAEIPDIYNLALKIGAEAFHIFLLVPVGCGLTIAKEKEITPEQYEEVLNWYYDKEQEARIELKATCAPHYYRIRLQRAKAEGKTLNPARGCLAGSAVCFVSHKGDVQPCGYLPLIAGNVRQTKFKEIWEKSELFDSLRKPELLKGKCGECEYKVICEGCRARAYAAVGDYLEAEPFCTYEPKGTHGRNRQETPQRTAV
jgi:heme b synthase